MIKDQQIFLQHNKINYHQNIIERKIGMLLDGKQNMIEFLLFIKGEEDWWY